MNDSTGIGPFVQNTIERRFGLVVVREDAVGCSASVSLPLSRFVQPATGMRAAGPISFLVDGACGLANHYRRPSGTFAITSELSFDVETEAVGVANLLVAEAHVVTATNSRSLAQCTLLADGVSVGAGTVRSVFVPHDETAEGRLSETMTVTDKTTLAELLGLTDAVPVRDGIDASLVQKVDPVLLNYAGVVHGGVVATSLDIAAHNSLARVRAMDERATDTVPMHTASLRVSYLRPMTLGGASRYESTVVSQGRTTAVCETHAYDDRGRPAALARVTCHRAAT